MQDPGRRTFSFCLASHYSRREVPSYSRREANALNFPSFRARREEEEVEEDICRRDDSAREGERRDWYYRRDQIGKGKKKGGAHCGRTELVGAAREMRWHWGRRGEGGRAWDRAKHRPHFLFLPALPSGAVRCEASGDGHARGRSALESITHGDGCL